MSATCPKCGSTNVAVGNFPLFCLDCDWHYLNKHPCEICGEPSRSFVSSWEESHYRCKEHPMTERERQGVFSRFCQRMGFARMMPDAKEHVNDG